MKLLMPSSRFKSWAGRKYNRSRQPTPTSDTAKINNITGFSMLTTKRMPKISKRICIDSDKENGSDSSTAPKSLEKRFRMRPDGLVSKNLIGVPNRPSSIFRCNETDVRMHILKKARLRANTIYRKKQIISI